MHKFLISLLGLFNALYLTYLSLNTSAVCLAGQRCSDVISSSYASLGPFPLSVFGIAFFLTLLVFSKPSLQSDRLEGFRFILLCLGAIASFLLMIIQFFVIHSFCLFCTFSSVITFLLLGLSWESRVKNLDEAKSAISNLRLHVLTFIIFSIIFGFYFGIHSFFQHYTVTPKKVIAATFSSKSISISELDALSGIEFLNLKYSLHKLREQTFYNELLKKDSSSLKLSRRDYFSAFIRHQLEISHMPTRYRIQAMNGNPQKLRELLATTQKSPTSNYYLQSRYEDLLSKIQSLHNASFVLPDDSIISIQKNPHHSIYVGNPNANIQVTVFSDFKCSHCAHFHEKLDKILLKNLDLINVNFRHFPHAGSLSESIAKASICADQQDKFLAYADYIYSNQPNISMTNFLSPLNDLDINPSSFNRCFHSSDVHSSIQEDLKEANRLNLNSTPIMILNGHIGKIDLLNSEIRKARSRR